MFSLRLTIVFLVALGVHSQGTDLNNVQTNNQEKGYPFGKLRLSQDGKTEELIPTTNNVVPPSPPISQDQPVNSVQPLPSPCIGARPSTKLAYPKEKSKYILCRDEYHYEIFTCPNGGDYIEQTGACSFVAPIIDRCEQEKPCLYDGQCISLSNSTYKCICRAEWTGDRCEIPLNSCSKKPCGPGAECRSLKTNDFEQDYVCICHAKRGYGLNCQETVPNPCLKSNEQFFPYAFSSHAYIQCDGELIHFQPCGSLLYWNQEEKICDRKRPSKIEMPKLIAKLTTNSNENQQEKGTETGKIEIPTSTVGSVEQQNIVGQTGQQVSESSLNLNNQIRSDIVPQTQQWSSQGTGANSLVSNNAQTQIGKSNEQQTFGQQNQGFGSQQWLNSVPSTKFETTKTISAPTESWRKFDSQSNQINSQNLNRPIVGETISKESNVFRLSGNTQGEGQSWQTRPNTQFVQPQTWQTTSQVLKNQQIPTMNLVDGKSSDNQNRLSTNLQSNTQFGLGQQNFLERNEASSGSKWSSSTSDVKSVGTQTQPWSNSQTILSQPQSQDQNEQTFSGTVSTSQNINRLPSSQNLNNQEQIPSWQTKQTTQISTNQLPQTTNFNALPSRTVEGPQQTWQRFESRTGQSVQQPIVDTSAIRSQDLQNTNTQEKLQPWQLKSTGIITENQPQQTWQRFESRTSQSVQQPIVDTGATGSNTIRSQDLQNVNTQEKLQPWQLKSTGSVTGNQPLQTGDSITLQTRAMNDQQQPEQGWRRLESGFAPVQSQTLSQQSSGDNTRTGANRFVGQNLRTVITPQSARTWETKPNTQFTGNQVQTSQTIEQPQQSWRRFESPPVPTQSHNTNQQSLGGTTGIFRPQGTQNLNRVESTKPWQINTLRSRTMEEPQQQPWQRVETPMNEQTLQNQNSEVKSQSNVALAFQPKTWTNTKVGQQENVLTSQTPNNQVDLNQSQQGVPVQKPFEQKTWSPNQQFLTQGGQQLTTNNDMNTASNQNFGTRPVQPSVTQGLQSWQSNQNLQNNNQ